MPNRQRRNVRPMLEPMETRVVPSALGPLARHAERAAAHVRPINDSVRQPTASQRENNEALLAPATSRGSWCICGHWRRTPSALPTPAEQRASQISNIFSSRSVNHSKPSPLGSDNDLDRIRPRHMMPRPVISGERPLAWAFGTLDPCDRRFVRCSRRLSAES